MTDNLDQKLEPATSLDGIKIFAPDKSLLIKTGVTNLDTILTPQVVASAQKVIEESSSQFSDEAHRQAEELVRVNTELQSSALKVGATIPHVIDLAFALRTSASLADYKLVASLAKSLFDHCKGLEVIVAGKDLAIIDWHVKSIAQMLSQRIKGDGGDLGQAILAELQRLRPSFKA